MDKIKAKKYNLSLVKGLSDSQLKQHYELYLGYVRKINEIRSKLKTLDDIEGNTTYSPFRGLKKGETYAINGVKLHELYFENIVAGTGIPTGRIIRLIEHDFGSYSEWEKRFRETGKSARGWTVLSYDYRDNRLHNYLLDAHDEGNVERTWPLLILDVYEHAYMIDFGIDREKYLNVFFNTINWDVVNKRTQEALEIKDVVEGKDKGGSKIYWSK